MSLEELEPGNVPKGRRKSLNKRAKTHPKGVILTHCAGRIVPTVLRSFRGRTCGAAGVRREYPPSLCVCQLLSSQCHVTWMG